MAVQDITSTSVNNQAIAMRMFLEAKADEEARKAAEKAGIVRTEIAPLGPGEEVEYEAPGVVGDPESWLNRGLMNAVSAIPEVVLGKETGNTAIDMGLANIPGAGAGAILAAGGMPGLVDAVGLGEVKTLMKGLKHAGKIGENTARFILRNYDEDALRAVDDYVDRFPKVGNIQIPDAYKILSEGRAGEVFLTKELPENLQAAALATEDLPRAFLNDDVFDKLLDAGIDAETAEKMIASANERYEKAYNVIRDAAESGDFMGASSAAEAVKQVLASPNHGEAFEELMTALIEGGVRGSERLRSFEAANRRIASQNRTLTNPASNSEYAIQHANAFNDYALMQFGTPQKLEEIEARQLRSEEKKAAKTATKESKKAQVNPTPVNISNASVSKAEAEQAKQAVDMAKVEADRARYLRNQEKRREENRAITQAQQDAARAREAVSDRPVEGAAPEESSTAQVLLGGPNKWKENGWNSADHSLDYESVLGKRNLTEDEKRDAFVLDSLARHWAGQLSETSPVKDWRGRGNYEHMHTNYGMNLGRPPGVADKFLADVIKNKNSGNMPGTSFKVYRNPVSFNPAAKVIDVEGYDIYYPLFHKKTDEKLNSIESRYFFDAMDPQYVIGNRKIK